MTQQKHLAATAALETMVAAMAARDANRFTSVYAEDAVVWHNTSRASQTKRENTDFLAATMAMFDAMEYVNIRRCFTDNGVVQQHVLRATLPDSRVVEIPACLVVEMRGDKIARIDEYLDPSPLAADT